MSAQIRSLPVFALGGAALVTGGIAIMSACSSAPSNPPFDGGSGGSSGGFGNSSSSSSSSSSGGFSSSSSSSSSGGFGSSSSSSSSGGFGSSSSSSSSGGFGSSSSSSSSSSSGGGGTAQCAPKTATAPMPITIASNALVFSPANFLPAAAGGGMGGYGYVFSDGQSIACLDGNNFCADGTIMTADTAFTIYGAGVGVNLNQVAGATAVGMYTPTGKSGVSYALTNLPASPATLRVIIDNGGVDYCANVSAASGMLAWSAFTPRCYNLPAGDAGAALGGPPSATHVQFQVNSSASGPGAFNFCVTTLAFY